MIMSIAQELQTEQQQEEKKDIKKKMRNKYIKGITLSMYYNCYVDEKNKESDELFDRTFIIEKISREILQPLATPVGEFEPLSKEQITSLFEEAWDWYQDSSIRTKKEQLLKLLEPFKDDPEVLATFQKSIQALGMETNDENGTLGQTFASNTLLPKSNGQIKIETKQEIPQAYGTDDDYELVDVPM